MIPAPFTVLIVAATAPELAGLRDRLPEPEVVGDGHGDGIAFDYLVTGVGPVATAAALTERLLAGGVHLVINVGLAGALDPELSVGDVVGVTTETFGDLGAEDRDGLHLSLFDLGLADPNEPPYRAGKLPGVEVTGVRDEMPWARTIRQFVADIEAARPLANHYASGTTVSQAHGSASAIAAFRARNEAQVESMEGAAVFLCALRQNLPCLQFRAISNRVEPRDRDAWDIPLALRNLNEEVGPLLADLRRRVRGASAAPPPRGR